MPRGLRPGLGASGGHGERYARTSRYEDPVPTSPDIVRVPIVGGELNVRHQGDPEADAVVAIHGGPGVSHRYLLGLGRLTDANRVIWYDQRGTGASSFTGDTVGDFTLEAQTADLLAVLDATETERAHVLGHSWGGVVAMHFAGTHPERVASLVLVDTCPPTIVDLAPGYERFGARVDELTGRGLIPAVPPDDPTEELRAIAPVYFYDPMSPTAAEAAVLLEVFPRTGELSASLLTTLDLTETIAHYAGPVLVAFGAADPFGIEWALATERAFAHAEVRLEILEACGHMPWIECPDAFFPVVEDFLRRHGDAVRHS